MEKEELPPCELWRALDKFPKTHTIRARFTTSHADICPSVKDIALTAYCFGLPPGSKWPRMSAKKEHRIILLGSEYGYYGANQIEAAENTRIIAQLKEGLGHK